MPDMKSKDAPIEHPKHIYQVVANVTHDGSVQKNIFKSEVSSVTKKHYIIAKNSHYLRAVHVDRHLIGGDVSADISLDFCIGRGWCLEEAVEETYERIKELMVSQFFKKLNRLNVMLVALKEKEPLVTERDTDEFG